MEKTTNTTDLEFNRGLHFERERFQRELHDGLAQELLGMRVLLTSAVQPDKDDKERTALIQKLQTQMANAMKTLYGIIHDRIPQQLQGKDLIVAMRELLESTFGSLVHISGDAVLTIGKDPQAIHLLRIAQEFVRNSVSHGNPSIITVILTEATDGINLWLHDDGIGFDVKSTVSGNGVRNIKQRLEALNANYHFVSTPGEGTALYIQLPFAAMDL